jgi:hypothetical protein
MPRIRLKNLKKFQEAIQKFPEEAVPSTHLTLQKRITLDLLRRVVFRTPVDTGRAMGNWQVGRTATDSEVQNWGSDPNVEGALALSRITKPFGVISIFNNVGYILPLENGSSKKSPRGMVKVSVAEVEAQFG